MSVTLLDIDAFCTHGMAFSTKPSRKLLKSRVLSLLKHLITRQLSCLENGTVSTSINQRNNGLRICCTAHSDEGAERDYHGQDHLYADVARYAEQYGVQVKFRILPDNTKAKINEYTKEEALNDVHVLEGRKVCLTSTQ